MKIHTEEKKHVNIGSLKRVKFTADDEAVKLLIANAIRQYNNPEKAFCQETCANAYDSHYENGNPEKPFDMHLPCVEEPWLEIRDYGTGLSHDFMINEYTKACFSTKRDSNKLTGSFGLGRLTFLSVTQQAAITSYYNGKKYLYTVNYSQDGGVEINYMGNTDTEEPNGLSIKFPVVENRISSFEAACRSYFISVDLPHPNFTGPKKISLSRKKYLYKSKDFGLLKNKQYNKISAIMGNICYPIVKETLVNDPRFRDVVCVINSPIDLFFDIGDIVPLSSRENLDMCDKTSEAILNKLKIVKDYILKSTKDRIKKSKHLFSACRKYDSIIKTVSTELSHEIIDLDLSYDGVKLNSYSDHLVYRSPEILVLDISTSHQNVKLPVKKKVLSFSVRSTSGSWPNSSHSVGSYLDNFMKHVFFYKDTNVAVKARIDHHYTGRQIKACVVDGPKEYWDEFKEKYIAIGANPKNFIMVSSLSKPPVEKRVKEKNPLLKTCNGYISTYYPKRTFNKVYLNDLKKDNDKIYYLEMFRNEFSLESKYSYDLYKALRDKGLSPAVDIVCIGASDKNLIKDNWVNLNKYIKDFKLPKDVIINLKRKSYIEFRVKNLNQEVEKLTGGKKTKYKYLTKDKERKTNHLKKTKGARRLNNLGKFLNDNKFIKQRLKDIDYLLEKYEKELSRLNKGYDTFEDLCKNFDKLSRQIDTVAHIAESQDKMPEKVKYFVDSQLHILYKSVGDNKKFDISKLKKELQDG
jgi:hypothetical protein